MRRHLLPPSTRKPRRPALLGGSAICGAAALLVQAALAGPILPSDALPGAPTATAFGALGPGGGGAGAAPAFTTASNLLTVDVHSSRSIITWDSFNVGGGSTVAFSGMSAGDIAVNRATSRMVIEGQVTGGGALWFLSPGGVFVNGGTITAGGGVLMSNGTLNDSAFLGSGGLSGALAAIQGSAALISLGDLTPADTAEVTLNGDVVLSSSATLDVDVAKGGAVTLTATAGVDAGALTATAGDLTVKGSSIAVSTATAAGKLSLQGPVVVGADGSTLTADGPVSLTSTVDGAGDLTISTPGQTTIASDVGGTTPLARLTVGSGPLRFNGSTITTTGDITLQGVTLGGAGAATFSAGGAFEAGDISGAAADVNALAVTAGSTLTLGGVGNDGRVTSASFAGGGPIALGGDVSVLNDVNFLSAAALTGSGVRRITAGGATFQAVAMANNATLSVNVGPGAAIFNGAVGTTGSTGTKLAVRAGTASFTATNHVNTLAAAVASGGLDFTNSQALTIGAVDGVSGVNVAAGDVALQTTAGALSLANWVSTTSSAQVSLGAAGAISQTGGAIGTGRLLAHAGGDINLTRTNHLRHLGAISAPGQSISIADAGALAVEGPVTGKSVTLSGVGLTFTTLSAGDLKLDATSGALTGASATATTGHLKLNGATIQLSGAARAGRDIFATATAGDAHFAAVAAGRDASLTASGTLDVTAASVGRDYSVTARDFVGAALASPGHNLTIVDTGGGFTASGLTAPHSLSVTTQNGGALTVSGHLAAMGGDITLATTGGGALTLGADVTTAASRTTTLNASGAVSQSGGIISTGTITGAGAGGFALNKANSFSRLGSVTNTGAGGVTVVDASPLTLDGPLDGGSGAVSVTGASIGFGTLTTTTSLTLTATAGAITGTSATTATGDLFLSGRSVDVSGALAAPQGGVQVTASQGALKVGAATAAKDILLRDTDPGAATAGDGGSITAGALAAGADVGVVSADGGVTLASVSAGDDVAIRALYGRVTVSGDVKSGRDMPGVTRTDGSGAADDVVAGAKFRDFDLASTTDFVLKGHDVDIQAQAIKVTGAIVAGVQQPGGDNPDAATVRDATPSDVRLGSARQSVPTAGLAASILVGDVTATRDIQIDAGRGVDAGALRAGQDVAVLARGADAVAESDPLSHGLGVTIGSAAAGRHVVLYSIRGRTHVLGAVAADHSYPQLRPDSTGDTSDGAGERLAAYIRYLDLDDQSRPFISGAGDVVVVGRGVDLDGAVAAAGSMRVQSGTSLAHGAGDTIRLGGPATATSGDIRLVAFGADSGAVAAITTNGLSAGGDVAAWSRAGGVSLGSIFAADDTAIRATGAVVVAGTIDAGSGVGTGPGGGGDHLVLVGKGGALTLSGHAYDLATTIGGVDVIGQDITISGSTTAGSNARLQAAGGVTTGAITASVGDVLVDAGGRISAGELVAGRDVGVRSTGAASGLAIASAAAGDDVVLRGKGDIEVAGDLKAGSGADSTAADQAGDLMAGTDQIQLAGAFDLAGQNLDIKSGGAVRVGDAAAAGTDFRIQAGGGVTVADVQAGRDLLLDASNLGAGALVAGGDVALYARDGGARIGSALAADDVVVRALGDLAAGKLEAKGEAEGLAGDRLTTAGGTMTVEGRSFDQQGANIDLRTAGVALSADAAAAGDLRIQSLAGAATAGLQAGRDVLLDASGDVSAGAVKAGRDVGMRSTAASLALAGASAGDDVVLRAAGDVAVGGPLSAADAADGDGAADLVFNVDRSRLAGDFDLGGANIDLKTAGGSLLVSGDATAASDVRVQSSGPVQVAAVSAGRDLMLDGGAIAAGDLSAGGDIALRGRDAVGIGSAAAGDDLVVRARGAFTASGALAARGDVDGAGVGDRLLEAEGAITAAGRSFDLAGGALDVRAGGVGVGGDATAGLDAHIQSTDAVSLAGITAGRDVLVDAAGAVQAGAIFAGRDVAVRSTGAGVSLGEATAGDDLVLRAARDVRVTGALTNQGAADADGAADALFGADRTNLAGDFDLAGSDVDVRSSAGGIAVGGAVSAARDARLQTAGDGAILAATVGAGRDVVLDAASVTAGALDAASGDVAVRTRAGGVILQSVAAGDDVIIRAAQDLTVSGSLASGAADGLGAGDRLLATSGAIRWAADTAALDKVSSFDASGGAIDIRGGGAISVGGAVLASGPSVRFETPGELSLASITAEKLIFVRAGGLTINGEWRAPLARIEATSAADLVVGDAATAPSGAMVVTNAQFNRLDAATVQMFAGDTSGVLRGAGLTVGALSVDVARVRSGLELYAGSTADVLIVGALAPSTEATNSVLLRIGAVDAAVGDWTPRSIRIVADTGGSIGQATTTDGRSFTNIRAFGGVELNARESILAGYQNFIDRLAIAQPGEVPALVRTFNAAQGPNGPHMLLTAGTLSLRADRIAQQDTSNFTASTRTGIYINGSLYLGRTRPGADGAATPDLIELSGAINNGAVVLVNESAALSNLINLGRPGPYYRMNSCVILQTGACSAQGGTPDVGGAPNRLLALQLFDRPDASVADDPTVASATNEEIWRDPE